MLFSDRDTGGVAHSLWKMSVFVALVYASA